MRPRAVGLLYESLSDLDLAVKGLSDDEATASRHGGSSFAWTAAHATQMFESWILHQFMGRPRHPLFSDRTFGAGGSGASADWPVIRIAIDEVQTTARPWLDAVTVDDLARGVPYTGSVAILRGQELNLEYALLRIAAHHFTHAGEIAALRGRDGESLPDNRGWGQMFL